MGYSSSERTLQKMLPHLKLLQAGKDCVWTTTPGKDTRQFGYKIREALYIASEHFPESYPQLALAANRFEIKVDVASGRISARGKGGNEIKVQQTEGVEMSQVEQDGRSLNFPGEQSTATIIQAWIDSGASASRLYFPDASLTNDELTKMYNWSQKRNLLMFVSGQSLTLQTMDEELADLAWNPEDLEGVK